MFVYKGVYVIFADFNFNERFGEFAQFGQKCLVERQGSVRVVSRPSLTTLILGGLGNSFRVVLLNFGQFSGSILTKKMRLGQKYF